MIEFLEYMIHKRDWLFRLLVIAFTITFIYVGSKSIYSRLPVVPADVAILVDHHESHGKNESRELIEIRKYIGLDLETLYTYRFIYEEKNPTNFLLLEGGDFEVIIGEFPVMRTIHLPSWVQGRWCSSVTLGWWPAWSQRSHAEKLKDVCFETSDYE